MKMNLFLALLLISEVSFGSNIDSLSKRVVGNLNTMGGLAQEVAAAPCVPEPSRGNFSGFSQLNHRTGQALFRTSREYLRMAAVTIQGSGKCDGSFQSVSAEALRRANRTASIRHELTNLRNSLAQGFYQHLLAPQITVNHSAGAGCASSVQENYSKAQIYSHKNLEGLDRVLKAFEREEKRWREFQWDNEHYAAKCGEGVLDSTVTHRPSNVRQKDETGWRKSNSNITKDPKK